MVKHTRSVIKHVTSLHAWKIALYGIATPGP